MNPFLLAGSILSFITGGLLIIFSCAYTSGNGPFNFNLHDYYALTGLGIVTVGYVCLLGAAVSRKTKSVIFLASGLLIFAGGQIFMSYSRKEVEEFCWGESAPIPPVWICLLVYYTTVVGLSLHGFILYTRKK